MKKPTSQNTNSSISVREIGCYSMGALGRELGANTINAFILVYLSIYMHLNPLILTIVIVCARILSPIFDPILATFINNSKSSKFGKYKPWIVAGVFINSIFAIALYVPVHTSGGLNYIYYIVMFLLWGMSYSVYDVPYWSMMPTIANTTEDRNRLSSFTKLIGGFGAFMISTIGTSLILPNFAAKGIEKGYLAIGVVGAAIVIFSYMFVLFGVKEKHHIKTTQTSIKDIFGIFKQNDQLRAYAGLFLLYSAGNMIAIFQLLYLYVYCYENAADYFYSKFSFTMFWIIACTLQGVVMIFYNFITKFIAREKMLAFALIISVISYVLMFSSFFFLKQANGDMKIYWINTIVFALCSTLAMLGNGIFTISTTVMIADIVDYGEWKTKKRCDSVIFSVQTFLYKMSIAFAQLILGIGIMVAGLPKIQEYYDPKIGGMVQRFVDSAGNNVVFTSTTSSLIILRAFMFLIPIPLTIISYIIYKKKYWLVGEKYDKIKAEVEASHTNDFDEENINV